MRCVMTWWLWSLYLEIDPRFLFSGVLWPLTAWKEKKSCIQIGTSVACSSFWTIALCVTVCLLLCLLENIVLSPYVGVVVRSNFLSTGTSEKRDTDLLKQAQKLYDFFFLLVSQSRVSDQNGVSLLYIMLVIHHSGWEPSQCWPFVISPE